METTSRKARNERRGREPKAVGDARPNIPEHSLQWTVAVQILKNGWRSRGTHNSRRKRALRAWRALRDKLAPMVVYTVIDYENRMCTKSFERQERQNF